MWKYLYKPQIVIYRSLNRIMWFIHRYMLTADIFGNICDVTVKTKKIELYVQIDFQLGYVITHI